jgi:hypothetical protein
MKVDFNKMNKWQKIKYVQERNGYIEDNIGYDDNGNEFRDDEGLALFVNATKIQLHAGASEFIEHTCDFADYLMQKILADKYEDYMQGNDDDGYSYTEDGQDLFNELLEDVEHFLGKFGVVNGTAYEDEEYI